MIARCREYKNMKHFAALRLLASISLLASGAAFAQAPNAAQPVVVAALTDVKPLPDGIAVQAGPAQIRITALRDDILRVRESANSTLPEDASWAVDSSIREKSVNVQPISDSSSVGFRTAALEVRVERNPLRVIVRDLSGKIISEDAIARPTEFALGGFTVHKQLAADEQFYGLGDKLGTFNRRDQAYTDWNTDVGPQEAIDPLYKSIPFYLGVRSGLSYGLFLDNTWRTWFDFGKSSRDSIAFGAEGGPLDYYVLYGPTPKQVVLAYTYLTGKPPLPPLWALGFQQSRYSYATEPELKAITDRLRADKIPSDVVYLDIDYQYRNRPFTVDPVAFPGFQMMVDDLKKQHFHLVLITDLHIADLPNQAYMPYDSGHAGDNFVKKADGGEFVGIVWPGKAVFPDFTRAQTRAWWGTLYQDFVKQGVSGFWNDMNEPSVFDGPGKTMPLDNIHRIDEPGFQSRTATHAEIYNIVGMENERATFDGLLKLNPNERPFVLTRATYAGGQRYGFTWTGDNSATWNHLRLSTQQLLNLGLSGISMVGDDIGGFNGSPQPDLLTKWIELGAFNPMFRDHSTKGSLMQEVWVHGEKQEAIRRKYIETRYRLLPYIYTLADEASRTGLPMMRPIFLEFPTDFDGAENEFLLGPSLLVAPNYLPELMDDYAVSYPPGNWYDFWTGEKMLPQPGQPDIVQVSDTIAAGQSLSKWAAPHTIHPQLDKLPVYARAGSIIPMQPVVQSTDEVPNGPLELRVYPGPGCTGSLYQDDGHTYNFQQGAYLRQTFTCMVETDGVVVDFGARQGNYPAWWKSVDIVLYGWNSAKAQVKLTGVNGQVNVHYDEAQHALHMTIPDVPGNGSLRVTQ